MEDYTLLLNKAKKEQKLADYMNDITAKFVKNKKIIVGILNHIYLSFNFVLKSYLLYERRYKRIKILPTEPELILELFFDRKPEGINQNLKPEILKVLQAIKAYNSSGLILEKLNKYIFVSEKYELIGFKQEDIKNLLKLNKELIKKVGELIK